jgi:NADH dehydrogenase [ubiquinone] 1 alpha subcomplex assembly factor 5
MTDAMQVFDRTLVRRRRDKAAAGIGAIFPILEAAAERLLDRLDDTTHRFTRALDLGGRGVVAPLLRARGVEMVVSADLSAPHGSRGRRACRGGG